MIPDSGVHPRLGLSEQPPAGRRALAFGILWLGLGALAAAGAVWVAIDLTSSVAVRILVDLVLVALCTAALMLASDSVERWLDGRAAGWRWLIFWGSTSVAVLAVVVVVGAVVTS